MPVSKSEFVDAILLRLEGVKTRFSEHSDDTKIQTYFADSPAAPLGALLKCLIATYVVQARLGISQREFCRTIIQQQGELHLPEKPQSTRGPVNALGPFTILTYQEFLSGSGRVAPKADTLQVCVKCVLKAADARLGDRLRAGHGIFEVLRDFRGTARSALERCLDMLDHLPDLVPWNFVSSRVHGSAPKGPARGLLSRSFDKSHAQILTALKTQRSVEVSGPHYCGKHKLLRKIVTAHRHSGFATEHAQISLCALSLHEMTATEAISHIAAFYRSYFHVEGSGRDSVADLLTEIGHFARQVPALIVISGLDTIDSNEVVRALNQDLVGEMVSRILEGHTETRLLVSTSVTSIATDRDGRAPARSASVGIRRPLRFDELVNLADDRVAPINYQYRALRQCATALCDLMPNCDTTQLEWLLNGTLVDDLQLRRAAVSRDSIEQLGRLIAKELLDAAQLFCLGLVALSHDGLMPSTLTAIIAALPEEVRRLFEKTDAVTILDQLPDEVVRKPRHDAATGPACYQVERALQAHLLSCWRDSAPLQFRQACWGIARAAAKEARDLRVRHGVETSAGRDVQVLIFLLACVDASKEREGRKAAITEWSILPPLQDSKAPMPDAQSIVQFAFSVLFERDLARSATNGATSMDDARLRLAAVVGFLNNRAPWLTDAGRDDPDRWEISSTSSPWLLLDLTEQLKLLSFAATAAARLNLRRLIVRLTRLAEETAGHPAELSAEQYGILSRIQRRELDVAIMLGGNPGHSLRRAQPLDGSDDNGLAWIEQRAENLIAQVTGELADTPEAAVAVGKLRLRLAEILHLRGKHVASYQSFDRTWRHTVRGPRPSDVALRIFGGRSLRMLSKLLVELARAQLFGPHSLEPIRFDDGLELAMLKSSATVPRLLARAQLVADSSIRTLSSGSVNNLIGTKIDQSRIAAVQLDYKTALEHLDEARALIHARGASRDTVLELLSLQGRTLSDAAAFASATAGMTDHSGWGPYLSEVERLATHLRMDARAPGTSIEDHAMAISAKLCELAASCLATLKTLVEQPGGSDAPYAIFAAYLEIWNAVVRSRPLARSEGKEAQRAAVIEAGRGLEAVLADMVRTGYLLPHREARLLVRGLAGAGVAVELPPGFPPELEIDQRKTSPSNSAETRQVVPSEDQHG